MKSQTYKKNDEDTRHSCGEGAIPVYGQFIPVRLPTGGLGLVRFEPEQSETLDTFVKRRNLVPADPRMFVLPVV